MTEDEAEIRSIIADHTKAHHAKNIDLLLAHGSEGFRGRAEGVFVGGELDDFVRLQTQFAGDVLDRLSGFVGKEVAQPGVGNIPE